METIKRERTSEDKNQVNSPYRKRKRDLNREILALLDKYGQDTKRALKENKKLEYLYALAPLRENLLEWYDFKKGGKLLQVGADFGAMTGLYLRRTGSVTVLDEAVENLEIVKARYRGVDGLTLCCDSLTHFAGEIRNCGEQGKCEVHANCGVYQYVTIIGSLNGREALEAQIRAAKALLAPGGALILAACNQFGLKYFAGTERDIVSVTKRKVEKILPGGRIYYPMPDYKLPSSIYSEKYLPKKGDLSGMPALYDYPRYLLMDVGAAFDAVCEDGQFGNFANSYLVIWDKGE